MFENIDLLRAEMPWFFCISVFVFGACIGSFLNVCIYRIPEGLSVVFPGSRCSKCGTAIKGYHNLPIIGWILLRGKAHCCGEPFSIRYPAIETLTGLLFLACWLLLTPLLAFIFMFYCALMLVISFIDLDHFIIPDRFSVGGMLIGLILSGFFPSLQGIGDIPFAGLQAVFSSLLSVFVSTALIYWIMTLASVALQKEAMGEGDVKLMGTIGAFLGWKAGIFALFGGSMIGCVAILLFKLVELLFGFNKTESEDKQQAREELDIPEGGVPFGPMLALGSLVYLFYAKEWFDAYIHNFIQVIY